MCSRRVSNSIRIFTKRVDVNILLIPRTILPTKTHWLHGTYSASPYSTAYKYIKPEL